MESLIDSLNTEKWAEVPVAEKGDGKWSQIPVTTYSRLIHDSCTTPPLFILNSFTIPLWSIYNSFTTSPWLLSTYSVFLWDPFTTHSRHSHDSFKSYSRFIHDLSMTQSWLILIFFSTLSRSRHSYEKFTAQTMSQAKLSIVHDCVSSSIPGNFTVNTGFVKFLFFLKSQPPSQTLSSQPIDSRSRRNDKCCTV